MLKKIISCTLIGVSIVLLFTSWVMLTPGAKTEAVNIYNNSVGTGENLSDFSEVIKSFGNIKGISFSGLTSEKTVLDAEMLRETGAFACAKALADGGLDITQTAVAAGTVANIAKVAADSGDVSSVKLLGITAGMNAYRTITTIVFILSLVFGAAALVLRLLDRFERFRKFDIAFFITQVILFILAVIFAGVINTGVSTFPVLGISIWGILAMILACPYILLDKLPFEKASDAIGAEMVFNSKAAAMGDSVNATFSKISDKMGETAQSGRILLQMKNCDDQLKDQYYSLGKNYYSNNIDNPPEEMRERFLEIAGIEQQMKDLQADMDVLNRVIECPNCGTKWDDHIRFCGNCGTKLPERENGKNNTDSVSNNTDAKVKRSFCKYCGARVNENDEFCPACGESL